MKRKNKPNNFWHSTWRLLSYLKPWKIGMLFVVLFALLSVIFQTVAPKILGEATTVIYNGIKKGIIERKSGIHFGSIPIDFTMISHILITVAVIYLLSALSGIAQQLIMTNISQNVVYKLRRDLKDKMQKLPMAYYDNHSNGDIMSRAINDIDNVSTMLQNNLNQFINSVFTFIGVLYMMLTVSWQLTLVALSTIPLILLVVAILAPRSQRYFSKRQRYLGVVNGKVEEDFAGHNIIKTFNREQDKIDDFEKQNQKYYDMSWRAEFISSFMFPLMNFIKNLDYVFVAIIGGIKVINGTITLGNVQAFLQYTNMFNQPISQLANLTSTIQSTIASAERIFNILDEPEMQPIHPNIPTIKDDSKIDFQHVDFKYLPDRPLIKDFNLKVKPHSTVAIVGPTGAGKSTIINLLERFYNIQSGSIKLDGKDIRNMSMKELRSHISIVLQDSWLFTGSIYDNIKYGNLNATPDDVYQAAKEAQADEFIKQLPDGYHTILNEEASNVSQGQRQLITIARAFISNPEILILDEATSSVDTKTETLIQNAMDRLIQGRTSFVVAHRLSTIQNADKIIVMNHGSIIETGTHKSLMKKNGFYADMYNSQFSHA
ncbi:multidrug ABC transporter ATP-binding protein [Philodulcilactobacillus myokoensis]|uniref:Multidrug ABC transporter ATP-binding protein n=1 Tax=Philodulcilactobacillus myokoensis TaxID=2929573 RepID=A0A9W6ET31_9LACO|nr:ABC transporter ATP-binding protein [Philodulcilactobacillus myokoensis]GLB47092.1 multidrug ABC transporter ATP-binding protein [Philodulcilactobacillus myokoensis]